MYNHNPTKLKITYKNQLDKILSKFINMKFSFSHY